jgi:hypothetical protein
MKITQSIKLRSILLKDILVKDFQNNVANIKWTQKMSYWGDNQHKFGLKLESNLKQRSIYLSNTRCGMM